MAATSESCCIVEKWCVRDNVWEKTFHTCQTMKKNHISSQQPMKQRVNVEHSLEHWGLSKKAPDVLPQESVYASSMAYLINS